MAKGPRQGRPLPGVGAPKITQKPFTVGTVTYGRRGASATHADKGGAIVTPHGGTVAGTGVPFPANKVRK